MKREKKVTDRRISNMYADGETFVSSDKVKMFEVFGDSLSSAGVPVTATSAMRVSAVFACVKLIAGSVASLPIHIYKRTDEGRERFKHDYWWLLNEQPCPQYTATSMWEYLAAQTMLQGDGFAYLRRNKSGRVTDVIPWDSNGVLVEPYPNDNPKEPRRLRYFFQKDGKRFGADQDDVLHLTGFGFNGIKSMSAIEWGARSSIGIAIRGDEFAGKFFSSGGQPQHAILSPHRMDEPQQEALRQSWIKKYSGNGPSAIPLVLTEGLGVKELSMKASDAQLLESRQWQVIDIARAFGVPPFMIGANEKTTSWGSGVEQMGIGFVKQTLMPHLSRWQDEMNRKLFRTASPFLEFNTDALMAGDSKAQAEYFAKALGGPGSQGWMNVNEVRKLKNLPPDDNPDFNSVKVSGADKPKGAKDEPTQPDA